MILARSKICTDFTGKNQSMTACPTMSCVNMLLPDIHMLAE
eukprot:UN08781